MEANTDGRSGKRTARYGDLDMMRALFVGSAMLFLPMQGCSVMMAMSGDKDPNFAVLQVGAPRGVVELELGTAVEQHVARDGTTTCVYEYTIGNKPSGGRAVAHGVMDVLTLGLWEVIGTPVEAFLPKHHRITVVYDARQTVVAVNEPVPIKKEDEEGGLASTPPDD